MITSPFHPGQSRTSTSDRETRLIQLLFRQIDRKRERERNDYTKNNRKKITFLIIFFLLIHLLVRFDDRRIRRWKERERWKKWSKAEITVLILFIFGSLSLYCYNENVFLTYQLMNWIVLLEKIAHSNFVRLLVPWWCIILKTGKARKDG